MKYEALEHLNSLSCRRIDRVFESELSTRATSGREYAAAILYAEYLGFRLIGRIPSWVRRLRTYPQAVPPELLSEVREILSTQHVNLTNRGSLVFSESSK